MRTLTLNIIKGYGLDPVLNVSQFDKGYTVACTVQKGAESFTPPAGSTATVEGRKPDGTGYQYAATIDGSTVTFTMAEQMTVLSGRSMAEIVFYDADAVRIGTANFYLLVEEAPLNDETVISDTALPAIIDAANANAERAEDAADEAEATLANFAEVVAEQVEQMQIHEGQTVIDGTLTVSGAAADAKVTGDKVAELKNDLVAALTEKIADGYYKLEYIESDGTQYINSGVNPSGTLGFEIDFINYKETGSSTIYANLIGSRISSGNNEFLISTYSTHGMSGVFRIGSTNNNARLKTGERQKISYKNGVFTVDGYSTAVENTITSNTFPIYIFALNNSGSVVYPLNARLYSVKLYDGNTLVRDYIPAYEYSTGKKGLYDTVNNVFYTSAAGNDFGYSVCSVSDLANELETVSESVQNITDYNPPFKYMDIELEKGGYDANGNEMVDDSGVRWRTPDYIYVSEMADTVITVPPDFTMYVCFYRTGNVFMSRSSWAGGSTHDVSAIYSIRWTITKTSWTASTEEEANCVKIKEILPWYKEYVNPVAEYPDYYESQIKTVSESVNSDMMKAGANGNGFAFITDVHWVGNYKHSPSLLYYLKEHTNLNLIICGGDLIDRSTSNKNSQIVYMQDCVKAFKDVGIPFVTAIGNHERNSAGVTDSNLYIDENSVFSITQNPVNWMPLQYADFSDRICFYYDNVAAKTRYIIIDSGQNNIGVFDITAEEITWVSNIISSTDADYHIIVIVHSLGEYQSLNAPISDSNPFIYTSGAQSLLAALDALLTSHKIEAVFAGHTHVDHNDETTGGIPIIWTNSDAKWQYYGMTQPSDGTVDAQCFDVVTIDYANKKIYLRRVGRGTDRTISY